MEKENTTPEPGGEESLHELFLRCSNIISRRIGGNASRRRIVALLSERGQLTQRELQNLLGIQAGSLSELVSRMEKFGFLTRQPDETDRRRTVLRLTEKGQDWAREPREMTDERLFAALDEKERADLRVMLQKIDDAHKKWQKVVESK